MGNEHLEKQEQQMKFLDMFIDEIDGDLLKLKLEIIGLRKKAKDYYGYDFQEELNEFLSDLI